jgi:hypothetical protein
MNGYSVFHAKKVPGLECDVPGTVYDETEQFISRRYGQHCHDVR